MFNPKILKEMTKEELESAIAKEEDNISNVYAIKSGAERQQDDLKRRIINCNKLINGHLDTLDILQTELEKRK